VKAMDKPTAQQIEHELVREVAMVLSREPSAIKPDEPLHVLGMDSMGFVEILVFIERAYNLKLIESGLNREDFETLRALARRISQELR